MWEYAFSDAYSSRISSFVITALSLFNDRGFAIMGVGVEAPTMWKDVGTAWTLFSPDIVDHGR